MKKITLLFTLTLMGTSILNGMEPINTEPSQLGGIGRLPIEIQAKIIPYLHIHKKLDETIQAIKATSLVDKELNVLINDAFIFKKLVHMLANKFKEPVNIIAEKFNTPAAREYITLSKHLIEAVKNSQVEQVKQLINEGADVLFLSEPKYGFRNERMTMLEFAIGGDPSENAVKIVKILLDSGANPYITERHESLADLIEEDEFFDWYSVDDESQSEDYEIKQEVFPQFEQLLKEAMAKRQPSGQENTSGEGK